MHPRNVWLDAIYLLVPLAVACSSSTGPATPPPPPPPPAVSTVTVGPNPASVEEGSTVQLTATLKDASGNTLSGRSISWSSTPLTIATVNPTSGLVSGISPGAATVTATSEGKSGSATVNVTALPPIVIGQITPATLLEGQPATITGTGFSATASSVTIDGVAAAVTQSSTTSLTVTVPELCRPKGSAADVVVKIGSRQSNTVSKDLDPASYVTLAVGQQSTVKSPAGRCFQFNESNSAERYLIGVQSVVEDANSLSALTVETEISPDAVRAAPDPLPPVMAGVGAPGRQLTAADLDRIADWQHHVAFTAEAYERWRPVLQRLANQSRGSAASVATAPTFPATVQEGNVLQVRVPVLGGTACNNWLTISGKVRRITQRAIFVEDEANPVSLDISVIDQAGTDFATIYDADVTEFGQPGDLDGNSRVVIVITKEVNKLASPPLGYVWGGNVLLGTQCAGSNEGEIFYMRSPDPGAVYTTQGYTVSQLTRDFPNLLIHEFAHIIQQARRRAVGGQFMSSFVAEGLATAAQEVVGFQILGLANGNNYGASAVYSTWGADPRGFFGYVGDLIAYFGYDYNGNRIAGAPEQCTWTGGSSLSGGNPGPCSFSTRLIYGVTWNLIRQAIDRHFSGAIGQRTIFQAFSNFTGAAGYAEIEGVLGRSIATLLAEWAPSLHIDDRYPGITAFQQRNFNIRSVVSAWANPNAELAPRQRSFTTFSDAVSVRAGSTAFFEVSAANRDAMTLRVRSGQSPAPDHITMWIVRLQ